MPLSTEKVENTLLEYESVQSLENFPNVSKHWLYITIPKISRTLLMF